jgi:hypothetical protein
LFAIREIRKSLAEKLGFFGFLGDYSFDQKLTMLFCLLERSHDIPNCIKRLLMILKFNDKRLASMNNMYLLCINRFGEINWLLQKIIAWTAVT